MTDTPAPPRPAATTVLLRAGAPLEVFLVKRVATQRFMGGTHVFPGGRVDDADHAAAARGLVRHPDAAGLAGRMGIPVDQALAYVLAGCRELLEEAGVLLVPGATAAQARQLRAELDGGRAFSEAVAARGWTLHGGALRYFAHWVTPAFEPRRFTARFFAVELPAGQEPVIDQQEAVEGRWFSPADAVAEHQRGGITLPPPTLCVLDGLAGHRTLADALREPTEVPAVEPVLADDGGVPVLAFPGDPRHPVRRGVPGAPTRVVMRDGRFVAERVQA
ncbi:MAG: NUDIX hydrolase [Deltaproteobacteria bacterium]|nr:NUDIX hydrolase [Deltaproteobacteria bacterium]